MSDKLADTLKDGEGIMSNGYVSPDEDLLTEDLHLKVTVGMKRWLENRARLEHRALANLTRTILADAMLSCKLYNRRAEKIPLP